MNIDNAYIGFNPNKKLIKSDDYTSNSSEIIATTKCVANALADYSEMVLDEKANDSEVVHNTGNEEISGMKSFTGSTREGIEDRAAGFTIKNLNFNKGLVDKNYYWTISFIDNNEEFNELSRRVGYWEAYTDTIGNSHNGFFVYKNAENSQVRTGIMIKYSNSDEKSFIPASNNDVSLGDANNRWKQIVSSTATISTSDKRLKSFIENIPDCVLDAWENISWKQFKMNDAIKEKGNNARYHTGLIAQDIDKTFNNNGLDVRKYGLFCFDKWDSSVSATGEIISSGNQYSLRYEEALAVEAAYQRRRAERAEKRIKNLEERLDKLENKLNQ